MCKNKKWCSIDYWQMVNANEIKLDQGKDVHYHN